ncbi:unnamed protein product [Closterium sp. NIES-54]
MPPRAPPLAACPSPLQPASRPCSNSRRLPVARLPPLQLAHRLLAARPPPLQPARRLPAPGPLAAPCCPTGRAPPCFPAMTSLRSSGGNGDGGVGSSGSGGGRSSSHCGVVRWGVADGGQLQLQRHHHETLPPQQLREWYARRSGGSGSNGSRCAARGASRSSARYLYVIRTGDWAGQTCGTVGHTQSRCFSYLSDTQRAEFGDTVELPRWQELLRQGVDIFALDYDAILTAIYALTIGAEGDCFLCVLPDPGIEAAALGASEFALPGTTPTEALHTFTLDAGASRCFFRNSTTLTPLFAPVPVRLADPSGGPVLARSSTILLCPAVSASLTALACPPCLPCVEGRQRAAPNSSFPPTIAPLQTLHMDVWGPARVSGQGCERYFLLVVDDYTRYTTVFPLRSKGEVPDVLIPWIRAVRLQLRERFREDLPDLRLHSDRGGEFSSYLLWDFCRGEGIL